MRRLTLENGLTVILVPFENPAVVAAYGCRAGYRYDPKDKLGLSHLTEHVIFRGRDWEKFARFYEGFCDEFNGETDATSIVLYGSTVHRHAPRVVTMLGGIVTRPPIVKSNVQSERERLLEEASDEDESSDEALPKEFSRVLGIALDDVPSTIASLTAHDVRNLHRQFFIGSNSVLTVAGGFDRERVEAAIRERFSRLRPGTEPQLEEHDYLKMRGAMRLLREESRKVKFVIGFPTFGFLDHDRIALGIIRNHLSSRISSRLGVRLDSVGRGYSSTDSLWFFRDFGYFRIEVSLFVEKFLETLQIIAEELSSLRTSLVSADDLLHAQRNLKIRARIRFGDPLDTALFYTRQWINLGDVVPLRAYLHEVNGVTRQRIRQVSRKVFVSKRLVFIAKGQLKKLRKHDVRRTLRFRR